MYNGYENCVPLQLGTTVLNYSASKQTRELRKEEKDLRRLQKVKDKRQFVMTATKRACSDYVIKSQNSPCPF